MSLKKLSAWFLTDAGKKFSYFFAGSASTVFLIGNVLPHTLFLDKYKDIVHLYQNGFTVPLPEKLQKRFQKALELVEIDKKDQHLFKPFPVYGFDMFSAGSAYSHFGVIVGLPFNFTFESVSDIDTSKIKIANKTTSWDSEDGQKLLKSLVLSENAQLYAMAREIKYRGTAKPLFDPLIAAVSVTGCYGLATALNKKYNLYVRPLPIRLIMYSIVGLFTYGSWALCKDFSQVYYEQKIDEELTRKSPLFVEGGKEFYAKILDRNVALRKLMGKQGEGMYTALGNENYLIRTKHLPLVQRKSFFEKLEQQQQEKA